MEQISPLMIQELVSQQTQWIQVAVGNLIRSPRSPQIIFLKASMTCFCSIGNSCFSSLKDRSRERQRNSFLKNKLKCSHLPESYVRLAMLFLFFECSIALSCFFPLFVSPCSCSCSQLSEPTKCSIGCHSVQTWIPKSLMFFASCFHYDLDTKTYIVI